MSPRAASQLKPTDAAEPPSGSATSQASIELYWLPLGAGGWFVKLNGRLWEAVQARRERRRPLDLYHTALVVRVPEGRYVVENCWPIPDADAQHVASSWKVRWAATGWGAGGCSATRSAAGPRGSSPTRAKRWPAPSA